MNKRKGLLTAILTIIFTSLLCIGLYQFDNKYTQTDIQPISGVLFYSEDSEPCYLTRQWMIFPDVLLTPEEVQDYSGYRYYGDIGGENDNVKGSVTYHLTLMLPEETNEYALELTEVFSAYKLYVNNRLLLQLGDPSPESYQEEISNRIVTFSASGKTELLLSVSDHSGVKRGLTYPPAFGSSDEVLSVREKRNILHGGLTILALLGALLSISFGLRSHTKRGILTCLLCLSLTVITGYPLYHSFFTTGVQPLYTLEPACYYALLLLALILQCSVYDLRFKHSLLLITPCIVGLIITLVRFGAAAILPEGSAQMFSWLSMILKYYTAVCLLGLSIWALWHEKYHSILLLCGSTALAVCLVWDRLLPLYEPIYGGWFGEIGGGILVISLAVALWLDAADAYKFRLTYEASFQQMEQRLAMQKEHYGQLSEQVQLAREASHDLRHHMRTMRGLAEHQQWDRLVNYLNEYEPHVRERDFTLWSDHPAADAILGYYAKIAQSLNVIYDVRLAISPEIPIPDDELCIVLSNLLENAMEAMSRQSSGHRKIYLRGDDADGRLGIAADNTFNGELLWKDGVFISSKHPGPGLGLSSINTIVKKYSGLSDFGAEGNVFHASILIPLPTDK